MPTLLLSAFEPFGGESLNASEQLLQRLVSQPVAGLDLQGLLLPVDLQRAPQLLLRDCQRLQPDYLVMLGEAGGCASIRLERVALNLNDFSLPDNAGNQPRDTAILCDGPAAYFSTLPLQPMRDALAAAKVPVELSCSAGLFLCNHLFYSLMHQLPTISPATRAGFIHLPWLPEQLTGKAEGTACLPLELQLDGLTAAIKALQSA